MLSSTAVVCLLLGTRFVSAWGNLGHQTVGFVAQEFLAPNALAFVQKTLGSTYNFSLGPAATWADEVRSETAFKWSAPFHFVDAEDSAPTSCSVDQQRDCADQQCILSAIANYTTRVVSESLASEQIQEALKFVAQTIIDHFLGDVGQPLHVEATEEGGNDIDAICNGDKTNLHASWDTGMVETNIDSSHGGTSESYAADLVKEIKVTPSLSTSFPQITTS
ncbi:hypothetical protein EUX98_g4281 [Antrodiella citrinella]|uniref:Nuclease Le1 n=1 Tax=Antrodiella citrinella TaxID=2447956 RepID=A0A4S4MX57_9APHY|nr:hypothetical protein EUX98_g4281 [Antrodiella citrinella]